MAARDLTEGPIRGHLLRMSGFMLLTMLVQIVYGLIDIFWVGRLGRDAVAAVALGSNLMLALMAAPQAAFGVGMRVLQVGMLPAMALTFAASAIVGQNFGAGRPARVREAYRHALRLNLAAAALFCLVFHAAPQALIRPFSADPLVIAQGATFLRWISWNQLAIAVVFACGSVFSGLGNTLPSLFGSATRIGFIVVAGLALSRSPRFAPAWLWALSVAASVLQLGVNLRLLRGVLRRRLGPLEHLSS